LPEQRDGAQDDEQFETKIAVPVVLVLHVILLECFWF